MSFNNPDFRHHAAATMTMQTAAQSMTSTLQPVFAAGWPCCSPFGHEDSLRNLRQ